jgi:hypothetical protein
MEELKVEKSETMWNITTTSTLFLVWPLGLDEKTQLTTGFRRAYLKDKDREYDRDDVVFCLFRPKNKVAFEQWLAAQDSSGAAIDDYDLGLNYVVVVMVFPKALIPDMKLVLEGKYSQTSEAFKATVPKVHLGPDKDPTIAWQVCHKVNEYIKTTKLPSGETVDKNIALVVKTAQLMGVTVEEIDEYGLEYWPPMDEERETLSVDKILEERP